MSNAIIPREEQARALVASKMNQINIIVGNDKAKASAFGSAIVNMANDFNLSRCSVDSIVNTAMQIVQIGLHPNKLFGQAYVVPYGSTAQLQIGYKGLIALGMRNGWKFRAVAVYSCDEFSIEFNGLDDKIKFKPNYEVRNDDDGVWVFANLTGVIVYAKDSGENVFSEFVSKKKLEKLRLKSSNQTKRVKDEKGAMVSVKSEDALVGVWLEWAEEMYKAKALKYVASRLPINDRLAEAVSIEDEPIRAEAKIEAPKTKDLNQLLQSTSANSSHVPENVTVKENLTVEPVEVEIESDDVTLGSDTPHQILENELIKRGATPDEAEDLVSRYNVEAVSEILQDPNSIDNMIENLKR